MEEMKALLAEKLKEKYRPKKPKPKPRTKKRPGPKPSEPTAEPLPDCDYKLAVAPMSWEEHEAEAIRWGGHIASITSKTELDHIRSLHRQSAVWLGAKRIGIGNGPGAEHWRWIDDTPWRFVHWQPGEPNNLEENRVEMSVEGRWNDINSKMRRPAVYKREKGKKTSIEDKNALNQRLGLHPGATVALFHPKSSCFLQMSATGTMAIAQRYVASRDAEHEEPAVALPPSQHWARFTIVDAGNGRIALFNSAQNGFVKLAGRGFVRKDESATPEDAEQYQAVDLGSGLVALQNVHSSRFLCVSDHCDPIVRRESAFCAIDVPNPKPRSLPEVREDFHKAAIHLQPRAICRAAFKVVSHPHLVALNPTEEKREYSSLQGTASSVLHAAEAWVPAPASGPEEYVVIDAGCAAGVGGVAVQSGRCTFQLYASENSRAWVSIDDGSSFSCCDSSQSSRPNAVQYFRFGRIVRARRIKVVIRCPRSEISKARQALPFRCALLVDDHREALGLSAGTLVAFHHRLSNSIIGMLGNAGADGRVVARRLSALELDPGNVSARFEVVDAGNCRIALYNSARQRFMRASDKLRHSTADLQERTSEDGNDSEDDSSAEKRRFVVIDGGGGVKPNARNQYPDLQSECFTVLDAGDGSVTLTCAHHARANCGACIQIVEGDELQFHPYCSGAVIGVSHDPEADAQAELAGSNAEQLDRLQLLHQRLASDSSRSARFTVLKHPPLVIVDPREDMRTYTPTQTAHRKSTLYSSGWWTQASISSELVINAGTQLAVRGLAVAGRMDFSVAVSADLQLWTDVDGGHTINASTTGNATADEVHETETIHFIKFKRRARGQFLRLTTRSNRGALRCAILADAPSSTDLSDFGLEPGGIVALFSPSSSPGGDRFVQMSGDGSVMPSAPLSMVELEPHRAWARFVVIDAGGGQIALRNIAHDRFVRVWPQAPGVANVDGLGAVADAHVDANDELRTDSGRQWRPHERFTVIDAGFAAAHAKQHRLFALHNAATGMLIELSEKAARGCPDTVSASRTTTVFRAMAHPDLVVLNVAENARSYSSVRASNTPASPSPSADTPAGGVGPSGGSTAASCVSMLHANGSWSPTQSHPSEWLCLNARCSIRLGGVAVRSGNPQMREKPSSGGSSECVTSLRVKVSDDEQHWEDVDSGFEFACDSEEYRIAYVRFSSAVTARFVKIHATAWRGPVTSMRVAGGAGAVDGAVRGLRRQGIALRAALLVEDHRSALGVSIGSLVGLHNTEVIRKEPVLPPFFVSIALSFPLVSLRCPTVETIPHDAG
jgi:hypothetical protein